VIELHGALSRVVCLGCGARFERAAVHDRLLRDNPGWLDRVVPIAPDGDSELDAADLAQFRVVDCEACGAPLKPDVVFFGGSVPSEVVSSAYALVDDAKALLVVGSSLAVYSGFRFVLRAVNRGLPVALVNVGSTRADRFALQARIEDRAGTVLPRLVESLSKRNGG